MNRIEIATQSIRQNEGWRRYCYNDRTGETVTLPAPAKLTVGYGYNIEANGISKAVGELMLSESMAEAERGAMLVWGDAFTWADLSEERAAVIVEMIYQMGSDGVRKFVKFLDHARAGRWEEAAREGIDSKWAREDSPNRARELMDRLAKDRNPYE